jgi:hypothetical protein
MELNLRPPVPRFHPLDRRGRLMLAGLRGLGASNVNPTTIWTPQSGYNVGGGSTSYQAPAQVAVPACASSSDANTADSAACQEQLMAAQTQNLAADTGANLTVDQNICESNYAENASAYAALGITPPPNTCMEETYGLVPADSTGGVNILAGNATQYLTSTTPIAPTPYVQTSGGSNTPTSSGRPVLSFTNLTSGNNSVFNVGDRWQIQITGAAPNAAVSVTGGQGGASSTAAMGTTDSSGSFSMNGQMSAAQVGPWTEQWIVNGSSIGSFSFTVSSTSSTSTAAATGGSVTGSMSDLLSASTTVGGTSIPDWAIGLGAVVLLWVMFKK